MPTYCNFCPDCKIEFENISSILADPIVLCPECGNLNVRRLPQMFDMAVKQYNTLGSIAERNTKKMGQKKEEKIQQMANERAANLGKFKGKIPEGGKPLARAKKNPWWRSNESKPDIGLSKLSLEQKQRYIFTGKRPPGTSK